MKTISFFLSENFQFLEVKFSIYLYRHVFVMIVVIVVAVVAVVVFVLVVIVVVDVVANGATISIKVILYQVSKTYDFLVFNKIFRLELK